jgi:hypothetical protein
MRERKERREKIIRKEKEEESKYVLNKRQNPAELVLHLPFNTVVSVSVVGFHYLSVI